MPHDQNPGAGCRGSFALTCSLPAPRLPDTDLTRRLLHQGLGHQGPIWLEITGMRHKEDPQTGWERRTLIDAASVL